MIPIKDDNPQLNIPYGTYLIIFLNIFCWVVLQDVGFGKESDLSVCKYGLIPNKLLYLAGNTFCESLNDIGYFSVLSSMFMHGGWMHIIGNLLFLWVFGGNVEDSMGSIRFLCFYLLCGICAAFSHIYTDTSSVIPMVGASGAIGGVMGAYLILYPKVKVHILIPLFIFFPIIRVPAFLMLGYWIGLQFIGGIPAIGSEGGGIAFWAHIGGFLSGMIAVHVFKDDELLTNHLYYGWNKTDEVSKVWNNPENKQ